MTLLHDYFHLRNQQAFQRLLDGGADRGNFSSGLSSSGGKSWAKSNTLTPAITCDVNARDWLGRTVLHLACTSPDGLEYVRLLLRHPNINVNLTDAESHWTPLHRALYSGNIPIALLLLQKSDIDGSLQDFEGYTAFDLYNSTLDGTKPCTDDSRAELYTWGANRNATLGLGGEGDRAHPELVVFPRKEESIDPVKGTPVSRFLPIYIRQIYMSKLHTAVVTSESGGNLRLCGFGSGGRLGPNQHTQYSFKPVSQLTQTIVSVALGQDHTLALTKAGEVLSWGLNRFSQLGYTLDTPVGGEGFGRIEGAVQATPRKVQGPLRKEVVKGVAASKGASACWTDNDVYTWGTNNGQLGYDKSIHPQILPRKTTKITQPVLAISMTESAMLCLLISQDVICIWNDRHIKIVFPGHAFPSEMQPYRPPQAIRDAKIAKITSSEEMFAALSFNGELFTFSVPGPADASTASGKERSGFRPQRVWALRKNFSAIKDVALGSDGSMIICTESGHVFIRSRNTKSGQTLSSKPFKFQRLPHLQRVTQVCANNIGAFGALRVEYQHRPIIICGNSFTQDIAKIQPYLHTCRTEHQKLHVESNFMPRLQDNDHDDAGIETDIQRIIHLLDVFDAENKRIRSSNILSTTSHLFHGADVMLRLPSGIAFPAHRVILGARSHILSAVLDGSMTIQDKQIKLSLKRLDVEPTRKRHQLLHLVLIGCQPISALILLAFFYSDELLAIWDPRVSMALGQRLKTLKINPAQIKVDLHTLAKILDLSTLAAALESPVKCSPTPSLESAMRHLFCSAQMPGASPPLQPPIPPDVILQLADRDVLCHSTILRARSDFFASFFDGDVWTKKRWDSNGVIAVDMKHLNWHVMEYVLRFMCYGEEEMFDSLDFVHSTDDVLDFIFDVMAAANELLLDRLVLVCSAIILQHANLSNACYILAEATHLHAEELIERIQSFMTVNMELLLDGGMLDDIPIALVKQLAHFTRKKQAEKSPVSRSGKLINEALEKHADWLALQDIPTTIHRSSHVVLRKESANPTLPSPGLQGPSRKAGQISSSHSPYSPQHSPSIRPHQIIHRPSIDDIFAMDDTDVPPLPTAYAQHISPISNSSNTAFNPSPVWKSTSNPRVDMKAIMAETANTTTFRQLVRGSPPTPRLESQLSQQDPQKPRKLAEGTPGLTAPIGLTSGSTTRSFEVSAARPSSANKPSQIISTPPKQPNPSPRSRPSGSAPIQGLGPTITPTRQAPPSPSPSSSIIRRTSSKAWNQPPAQAPVPPTTGMSFIAIQQLQLDQTAREPNKDRPSLREIQEEEKALQEEADFLAWWTAEEERIKLETQIATTSQSTVRAKTSRKRPGKKAEHVGNAQGNLNRNRKPSQRVNSAS